MGQGDDRQEDYEGKDDDGQEEHGGKDDTDSDSDEYWPSTCVPAIGRSRMRGEMRGETTSLPSMDDVSTDL
mgnify:CR=1 FL=1